MTYEFGGEADPELVELLIGMKVSRAVAEALAADHPERIRPAVCAIRQRIAEGYQPRSLAATTVDAIRKPEKYGGVTDASQATVRRSATKSSPEPQPLLLPLSREESLSMIRSVLRVKLGRAPRTELLTRLDRLNDADVGRLAAAARGQEDLIAATEAVTGEAP